MTSLATQVFTSLKIQRLTVLLSRLLYRMEFVGAIPEQAAWGTQDVLVVPR